jgi:hypothetical protein
MDANQREDPYLCFLVVCVNSRSFALIRGLKKLNTETRLIEEQIYHPGWW